MLEKSLLIGIDVGGTNTDSVLLNPALLESDNRGVISFHKSVTTPNISKGITSALGKLFEGKSDYSPDQVLAVTIGTTHFINAVVEQDKARLEQVAVIRLCGPYSSGMYPFSDFPEGLKRIIHCYNASVNGGHRVDGNEIQPLDENAIREHALKIKEKGIKSISIVGIFSIINKSHEIRAAKIVREIIPDANIVLSSLVSGIGFLTRENASILNASILTFATKIIHSLISSIRNSGFHCPIFLTQNDGTVLTIHDALKAPIRTFSSGATNSMRGAAFLCTKEKDIVGKNIMVVDIGGTTTDVGLLLPNGFPRQVSAHSIVGGVRMNFSMPHVESIGLGGGSIVRQSEKGLTIGPDSVGSEILTKSKVFGGSILTTSDVTVAMNYKTGNELYSIGDAELVRNEFSDEFKKEFSEILKNKIERVIDRIRTSPEPLPVLLVGGGSFIAPKQLDGASKVVHPPYFQVANAIGAAMGKLSSSIERVEVLLSIDEKEAVIERLTKEVTAEIVQKGASESSVKVVDVRYDPVPYVDKTYSFGIKVVGDIDYSRVAEAFASLELSENSENNKTDNSRTNESSNNVKKSTFAQDDENREDEIAFDHISYIPSINKDREWLLSEVDLEYLRIGTYILGCGGGGTPYPIYLDVRNMLRDGAIIKVISPDDVSRYSTENGSYVTVGFAGSPTVTDEQLAGSELVDAAEALFDYTMSTADGVFALEIGGGNGLQGLYCGSSTKLNLPVIDADLMGRAYPTHSQVLPTVCSDEMVLKLTSVSDGNGNKFLITDAQSETYVERMLRASLSEIGASVGVVNSPMTSKQVQSMTVHHTLSLAWRIGRAVSIARQKSEIDRLPEIILKSIGGSRSGRKIFAGKIIGVEKRLFKGHVYGEVLIEDEHKNKLCIPFKNENIVAKIQKKGSSDWEVICSVPDLISVCYADSGEAVGTPDYRYGVVVFVLAFAPNSLWTNSEKALDVGGPKAFGPVFQDIEYKPVGEYVKPISVIDEYQNRVR
ncbi:uncharacterized protein PRCAT00000025001 [Priceomyces carsonii]|uniref:uncharacterized protein n=1 Tax=Priceomyces carsonii TaxID=28549 RepID=UPI002EDA76AE|nr:unnamed protein product [Priceomyces carsonii]